MLRFDKDLESDLERRITRKLFLLISVALLAVLSAGVGLGLIISERRASAVEEPVYATPEAMSANFVEVAKSVEPAVVNIDTKSKVPDIQVKGDKPESGNSGDILDYLRRQSRKPSYSVGSGFVVDKSGYILTNFHVVDESSKITVRTQDGKEYLAKIIGMDEETDLAVLKIDAGRDLPSVRLGDSGSAQVGDWVLAIGSPFGLAQTVTAGIISQTKRETPFATVFQQFIQTDAAINRGNSGGPLVNMKGEVIGVNSQIATSTGDYNGIGFALPSNDASFVYNQILKFGKVRRGYLGVGLDSLKPEFGRVYQLPELTGAIITSLQNKESAAAKAGLVVNDIITEFNGQKVLSSQDLIAKVAAAGPEKEISLTYLRETGDKLEAKTVQVRLGERPAAGGPSKAEDSADLDEPRKLPVADDANAVAKPLGLTLLEVTPQLDSEHRLGGQKGLLIKEIDPASFVEDLKNSAGGDLLRESDLIQRINRQTVTDIKSFSEIVDKLKPGDAVVLHVASYNFRARTLQQRIVQFTIQ
jgi:serine protease Do